MSRTSYLVLVLLAAAAFGCEEPAAPFAPIEPYGDDDAGPDSGEDMGGTAGGAGGISSPGGFTAGGAPGAPFGLEVLSAGCAGMSPDAVYVKGQSKNIVTPEDPNGVYAGDTSFFIPVLYNVDDLGKDGQSMPCIAGCAQAVTFESKIMGTYCAIGQSTSLGNLFEVVPDYPEWDAKKKKWTVATYAADNDIVELAHEPGTACGRVYAYPDRSGVMAICDGLFDSTEGDFAIPGTFLAPGRNSANLFWVPVRLELMKTIPPQLVIADTGELVRIPDLPLDMEPVAARAVEDGFLVVLQLREDLTNVRLFYISVTGEFTQRAAYPNPEGWQLYAEKTQEERPTHSTALRADGVLFAGQGKISVFGRVVRFDPDGSEPITLLDESKALPTSGKPFPLHFIEGFVTGG